MTSDVERRLNWFRQLRADWFKVMRPLGPWVPWELRDLVDLEGTTDERAFWGEGLITPAPQLEERHVTECAVVPTRNVLLERLPKRGRVAEVGTGHGEFSREILRITTPFELHLIDHAIQRGVGDLAASAPEVFVHEGDSAETLERFPDRSFDWIYIDAQHTYEGVSRDVAAARRKVKPDGLLVFNDYTLWSYVEMQPYGVVAAVTELCLNDGWRLVYLTLPANMYCDVAVRKIT